MTTGQRIKKARKEAGLTQAQLAEKLGVPFQSISQWERDLRKPKPETLLRIADALSISAYVLITQEIQNAFLDGFNELIHTKRHTSATTEEDAEAAEEDALNIFWYFDELDEFGQKRAIACVRALAGYDPIIDTIPPHAIDLAITALCKLNEEGQQKAVERIEELAEIPKYQKEKAPDATNIQD